MPTEVWTSKVVARQALRAAIALGLRQILVQALNILGGILLARILSPEEFGLYAIITFLLSFLVVFGGTGLATNLIRQPQEPSEEDYQAVFTVQQIVVAGIVLLFWITAPLMAKVYRLPPEGAWLFRLVSLSLVATSFQVIPQVYLERYLSFDKLAIIEFLQALIYNTTAVGLAWIGFGAYSFALALLARSLIGALLANLISPWRIRLHWDWIRIRAHMAFGVPYQGAMIVNLIKDTINPVFVAIWAGTVAVGYINWATMVANYPLLFLMLLRRLYMPMFSRLVRDPPAFRLAFLTVLKLIGTVVFTASSLLYVFRFEITTLVFGEKWMPALVLFMPFTLVNFLLAPTIVVNSALNALGRAVFVFRLMLAWMVATWVLGPTFILLFGWPGWGWANFGVNLLNLFAWRELARRMDFVWLHALVIPIGISVLAGFLGAIFQFLGLPLQFSIPLTLLVSAGASFIFLRREMVRIWQLWKSQA